jgi:hypothetical protein
MPCIDFGLTSKCSVVANFNTSSLFSGGGGQQFLQSMINGYNNPSSGGCQFFQNRVTHWTGQLANITNPITRIQKQAKIDWANCMLNVCCGVGGAPAYGCMDDGTRGNDYLNNQGTLANPQYGSVTPGTQALNYYSGATQDDGSCFYTQPVHGCKDPSATNYDPNADMDCDNNYVSEFNINYTNFQGIQPLGTWTPYGDESCCTYAPPPCTGCSCVDYNYRDGGCNVRGGLLSFSSGHNHIFYNNQEQMDSVIGGPNLGLWTAAEDVVGNTYNFSQMTDDSIGYTITIWDKDYAYLGKWHYSTLVPHWLSGSGFYCAPQVDTNKLHLQGVTHLDGPHAVVNYANSNTQVGGFQYGSVTHSFWKIECAATVAAGGGTVITDIGCNQTCWGNAPLGCCSVSYAPYGCYYFTNPNYPNNPACGNQPYPNSGSCWGTPSGYVCQPTYQTNTYPLPSGISNVFTTGAIGQQHWPCFASNGQISNECCGGASFGPSSSEGISNLNAGIPKDIVELSIVTSADENVPFAIGNWVKSEGAINIKSSYIQNDNQTVEVVGNDSIQLTEEKDEVQKILKFSGRLLLNSTKNIFNITFKTKSGYYYSKSPSLTMNFPGSENYRIKIESESKNARGYVTEKTFNVSYKNTGFDVFEADGHNIMFTNKIIKEVDESTKVKEITALRIGTVKNLKSKGNGNSKY